MNQKSQIQYSIGDLFVLNQTRLVDYPEFLRKNLSEVVYQLVQKDISLDAIGPVKYYFYVIDHGHIQFMPMNTHMITLTLTRVCSLYDI